MSDAQNHDYQKRLRLDIETEIVKDEVTGHKSLLVRFDPARYEIKESENKQFLYDKFDNWRMSVELVYKMIAEGLSRQPTGKGQYLGNAREYIADRRAKIAQILKGTHSQPYQSVDYSEEFLKSLPDGVRGFAILSLDIVGSTKLSNSIAPEANARAISLILSELARIAPFFHAKILKFTGDGILAYIPPPSFLTANDNAIDCALTMRGLIRQAVNPALQEVSLPTIDVRIGIESGTAVVLTIGHSSSKQQRDLIGKTLNMSYKIQASASPGEIRLGYVAYQNIHTMWKRGCKPAPPPDDWPYTLSDGQPDPIYCFYTEGANIEPFVILNKAYKKGGQESVFQ